MTSTQLALTLITLKILWTRIAFSAWSERPPSFQSKKSTIHLRGFANEFVMAIKGKNLSSHDKRWLTTPCTATLQNKRETFNTLFWTLRKSKIQSGELHSVTFNESVVSAMHTRPLRQRGANLSLSQVTSSDLQQGLKGSHGLTAADFNPTQNQAALQKSPPQQGLENTRIQNAWGILAKNHGLSHSPGLSWRAEWQGADGEEPPHGRSKATKVTKSTSLWKMATPFCLDTAAQGGQKRSPCSGVGGLLFLWVLGKVLLFGWFYKRNCHIPWASPVFTGSASGLDRVCFVPVCCSGMQFFHCAGPASCFPCKSHHIPKRLQNNSFQCGYSNVSWHHIYLTKIQKASMNIQLVWTYLLPSNIWKNVLNMQLFHILPYGHIILWNHPQSLKRF